MSNSKPYPECAYLGSDAAELTTFALSLRLVAKLQAEGHSSNCAQLQVGANAECVCKRKAGAK